MTKAAKWNIMAIVFLLGQIAAGLTYWHDYKGRTLAVFAALVLFLHIVKLKSRSWA